MIDVARARADTPGSQARVHLDNARASLMPTAVLAAVQAHLELEARVGAAEAAELRADEIERAYQSAAALVNADPNEITIYAGGSLDVLARVDRFVADVSLSIGRAPVDVQAIDRRAIVAGAGAYLRGPAGTGILVIRGGRRARTEASPAAVLGLGSAVDYARALGLEAVQARVDMLADALRERLAEIPAVSAQTREAIVTFEVENRDPRDVAWSLRKRGITVGLNGTAVRASPHYFNTEHELELLAETVRDL
jgi:selenocysteine lyase/cysteine desulfurase